ncbi:Gfo/Idh/MocA family protein [Hellea balneolensis]|uniref:Gfo/Idh/MocA family protein n=1 Tax=Hellea balneolensis TaxID=287478 RepID=UPI000409FBD8|nr:Gfo/Idh/MocA family oxidoreductase [Hellea balneolensis]
MIRIGVLGAARIAPKAIIAPVSKRGDCKITAVGCRSREKGLQFTVDNQLIAEVMGYKELCTHPDIDLVYIALPPSAHLQWAGLAMEHGKAVLCEKPAAMGAADAKVISETSLRTGKPFMEAFHYYFHPAFQSFYKDTNRLMNSGMPLIFEGHFSASIPKRSGELRYKPELGGGALMDLGCYPLHAFRQIFGPLDVIDIEADIQGGVDVSLTAHLSGENAAGKIYCNMTEGAERADYLRVSEGAGRASELESFVAPYRGYSLRATQDGEFTERQIGETDTTTYDYQLAHFIEVISGQRPRLTVSDMLDQAKTIEAIYQKAGLR